MPGDELALTVRIDGANETLKAFRNLPKEASNVLRDRAQALSELMAGWIRESGQAEGGQAALLVPTVKAKRDRLPFVAVGGTKRVGHPWPKNGRAQAFQLLFGSEFGHSGAGGRGRGSKDFAPHGFKPHRGQEGYWIFPSVEAHESEIAEQWQLAAEDVIATFIETGATDTQTIRST